MFHKVVAAIFQPFWLSEGSARRKPEGLEVKKVDYFCFTTNKNNMQQVYHSNTWTNVHIRKHIQAAGYGKRRANATSVRNLV